MTGFDLVIVGSGSGNAIPAELDHMRIALVERDTFGGTCLNKGCIPSKMLVYPADVVRQVLGAGKLGVRATLEGVDWRSIRDRVFARIDPIAAGGERYRVEDCPNITVFRSTARFTGPKELDVGGERITGERFVLAAGSRPFVPHVPGLAEVGFHTSDTIMRVDEVPERLVVLGGGYIAAELGHVFQAFGSRVTIVNRGQSLLRAEDEEISHRFTELASARFDLRLGAAVARVARTAAGAVAVELRDGEVLEADEVLVAAGRIPNSDLLDVAKAGVTCDAAGRVVVGQDLQTSVPGIWAFGDLANHHQLKHVANAEAKVVFHNVAHTDQPRTMDYSVVPHAVFGDPQVASVGLTEAQAAAESIPFVAATKEYGTAAYGWAMEDTTSFVKILAHAHTRKVLGAHLIGPQAATMVQILVGAMRFGTTVDELAEGQLWVHPALTEVVENCLLDLVTALC